MLCVPCRFPRSGICGDEGDVEEVGEEDHAAVEREELLPLVPAGGAEATHEDGDEHPGHGQGEDGGQPEQVPVEGGRDVPVGGVARQVAEHSEAGQALGKKELASSSSSPFPTCMTTMLALYSIQEQGRKGRRSRGRQANIWIPLPRRRTVRAATFFLMSKSPR